MQRDEWDKIVLALTEEASNEETVSIPGVSESSVRAYLAKKHGDVWNSFELARDFEVQSFSGSWAVVKRRADGRKGRVRYIHLPRLYWGFE